MWNLHTRQTLLLTCCQISQSDSKFLIGRNRLTKIADWYISAVVAREQNLLQLMRSVYLPSTRAVRLQVICRINWLTAMAMSMGVDPWVDRGTCPPYFLKWRGRPVFCPPTFSGVDIVCNAQHWLHTSHFVATYYSIRFRDTLYKTAKLLFTISRVVDIIHFSYFKLKQGHCPSLHQQ